MSQQKPSDRIAVDLDLDELDTKQPNCPEEKEKAIVDALKHFGMV